jgi:hypothetical protein
VAATPAKVADEAAAARARAVERQTRERESREAREREARQRALEKQRELRERVASLEGEVKGARAAAREAEVVASRAQAEAERARRAVEAIDKRLEEARRELRAFDLAKGRSCGALEGGRRREERSERKSQRSDATTAVMRPAPSKHPDPATAKRPAPSRKLTAATAGAMPIAIVARNIPPGTTSSPESRRVADGNSSMCFESMFSEECMNQAVRREARRRAFHWPARRGQQEARVYMLVRGKGP